VGARAHLVRVRVRAWVRVRVVVRVRVRVRFMVRVRLGLTGAHQGEKGYQALGGGE